MKRLCSVLGVVFMMATMLVAPAQASYSNATSFVDENGLINKTVYQEYCEENGIDINVDNVIDANRYLVEMRRDRMSTYNVAGETLEKLDIAGYFSSEDGISSSHIRTMYQEALLAYTNSQMLYVEPERNAYRHFYWNYQSTQKASRSSTKTYTTNYEYASKLQNEYQGYYNSAIGRWTVLDPENAVVMAEAEAFANVLADRDDEIAELNSMNEIDTYFGDAGIQDLYNNLQGRIAAEQSYAGVDAAYNAVKSTLCQNDEVTTGMLRAVYNSNDWIP